MKTVRPRIRWLWWAYAITWAAVLIALLGLMAILPEPVSSRDVFFIVAELWLLAAMIGYVSQRAIGHVYVWRWVTAGMLGASVISAAFSLGELAQDPPYLAAGLVAILLGAPIWWAAFAYGFLSPHLWHARPGV